MRCIGFICVITCRLAYVVLCGLYAVMMFYDVFICFIVFIWFVSATEVGTGRKSYIYIIGIGFCRLLYGCFIVCCSGCVIGCVTDVNKESPISGYA